MNTKFLISFLFIFSIFKAQNIKINAPVYAGHSYIFIISQGGEEKTLSQARVPANGKFTLHIPKEYAPYKGFARWLIDDSAEGGGLDLYIAGKDFSSSITLDPATTEKKYIIDTDNAAQSEMGELLSEEGAILTRYYTLQRKLDTLKPTDASYQDTKRDYQKEILAYNNFQKNMKSTSEDISQYIQITNINNDIAPVLSEDPKDITKATYEYITNELDWQMLYTSGQWNEIVNIWLGTHLREIKNPNLFAEDFQKATGRIKSPKLYTALAEEIAKTLAMQGQDEYIAALVPIIKSSGKISGYNGYLTSYTKGVLGSQASDLILPNEGTGNKTKIIKIADKAFQQTLLFFYQSVDCITCDQQLRELTRNYEKLANQGVRVIAISADKEEKDFTNRARTFPWKDTYCDYKGKAGINFKNYSVIGGPTIILVDANGKILSRGASINF
ncbi:peroxiredoxin [Elizabethkingia occulta]|uniref:Alkyl hydroperoxide reductase n=1 Tax=Elizabethkingia occulta TaxID=1867263 RepID=A0A1T3M9A2_9FLAO|nr:redoxin domain-containing protein [Elizabethkingia occulta]OPB86486.1 alkyl hydroperoxide reductase [Elizabethkingia occulta]OPC61163.1 alkyl hydroperoxide reductase [Elizabethkingia occulta]